MKKWYYYLHTNGELIGKNPFGYRDEDFTSSPFVKEFWIVDCEDRKDLWRLLFEALALDANISCIKRIAEIEGVDKEDVFEAYGATKFTDRMTSGSLRFIKEIIGIPFHQFANELFQRARERKEKRVRQLKSAVVIDRLWAKNAQSN